MIWQDIVVTVGSLVFSIVLIPQLIDCYRGSTVNVYTAVLTSIILGVFCLVYASLGMWLAAIPLTATIWGLIAWFSWRNSHGAW